MLKIFLLKMLLLIVSQLEPCLNEEFLPKVFLNKVFILTLI